ncbi:MAG TPA: 30S ribosomal protein S13 [bacterium]|nr:30S ribosomal protein S13 [bacterium]
MARIAGVDLPNNKIVRVGLTYIFGIGDKTAEKIIKATGIDGSKRISELIPDEINKIRSVMEKETKVEGELRGEILRNIKRLMEINCYRGVRHKKRMPVRGQRTHTNAHTARGIKPMRIGGAVKKPAGQQPQKAPGA